MASLVLGVAGAAVGSFFGQAALGYMIGSAIGGAFSKSNQPNIDTKFEGPRINDLKVTSSTYGAPIPIIYGAVRIAGNMIWSTGLIETKHVDTQSSGGGGGKGGGGGGGEVTQTTITYTYSASFAMALCEGLIQGVRRIWADGKLIYDLGSTANPASVFKSNSISSTHKIYFGSETQTADPTMSAYLGAANVPGYRGLAYIVFNNMQLENYGNRIPNLEFEVLDLAIVTGARILTNKANTGVQFTTNLDAGVGHPAALSFDGSMRVTAVGNDSVFVFDSNGNFVGKDIRQDNEQYPALNAFPFSTTYPVGILNGYLVSVSNLGVAIGSGMCLPVYVYFLGENNISTDLSSVLPAGEFIGGCCISTDQAHVIVFTSPTNPLAGSATINKYYILEYSGGDPALISSGVLASPLSVNDIGFGNSAFYTFISCCLEENLNYFWTQQGSQDHRATVYEIINGVMTEVDFVNQVWPGPTMFAYPTIYARNGVAWSFGGSQVAVLTRVASATITDATVSSVITDLVTRGVLTAGDIDVSALTAMQCRGYFISKPMSIRSAIEPLQKAFWFDATETSGKVKFIPRGGSSILTILSDDLGAYSGGGEPPPPVQSIRAQELELPRRVNVTYVNQARSYQQSTQYAARLITPSEQITSEELPIVLTDSEAVNVANVLLYNSWLERNTRMLELTSKYAYLDPCDIITVINEDAIYTLRIVQTDYGENGIVKLKTVDEDAAIYDPNAIASEGQEVDQTVDLPGPTKLALFDMPLLRDQDSNPGFYWASCGYLESWTGCALFISTDGGATYNNAGSNVVPAVIGRATTVLGDFTRGNIFDESNTVTVQVLNGELDNDTQDNILNHANVAMLGSELIQFTNAELVDTNTYKLSGLLRGRQGTDWATGTHVVDEVFALAGTLSWQRYVSGLNDLNLARTWKAATIGLSIAEAIPYTFTNTGIGLKPYSPVMIGGGRDSSGNITIFWSRRGRVGGGWNDNVEVPLSETSEIYSVDIMNGSSVVRTIGAVTETCTYTAAQQNTDFGHLANPVTINVYQISGYVGRGYAGAATI